MKLYKQIQITDLRQVCPNEAKNFTSWLSKEEDLTLIGKTIGTEMELTEKICVQSDGKPDWKWVEAFIKVRSCSKLLWQYTKIFVFSK